VSERQRERLTENKERESARAREGGREREREVPFHTDSHTEN